MKVNVRLLIILLVLGVGILGAIVVAHRIQMTSHAAGFLENAKASMESNDIQRGIKHYAYYLRLNSEDSKARAEYGIALKKIGDPKAIVHLEAALRDDPTNKEALFALAEIMLYQSDHVADARKHFEALIKLEPNNSEYREMLAKSFIREENYPKAEEKLLEIIKKDPTKLTSYSLLYQIYKLKLDRPEDAKKTIDQMVEKNPDVAEAYQLRARFLWNQDKEEAKKDLAKALELAPQDRQALILAYTFAASEGNLDEAKKYSLQLIEIEPKSFEGYLQMASIEERNLNRDEALKWVEKGIDVTGGTFELIFQKAEYLLDDKNKIAEAEKTIENLSKSSLHPARLSHLYTQPILSYLEARLNYSKEYWAKAKDQFEAVRPDLGRLPDWKFLIPRSDLFTAECYRQLGNKEKSLALTSRASRSDVPTATKDPFQEGRILRQEGKLLEAIAYFKRLAQNENAKINANVELFPLLIQRTLQQNEANRDWSEVDSTLAEIQQLLPDDPRAALMQVQAIIAKNKKNTQEAEAVLDSAVKRAKTRAKQWDRLFEELKVTLNTKESTELLKKASETWAKQDPYIKKGIEAIEAGRREQALKILEAGRNAQSNTERLWLTRIAIARTQKDWDRAEAITQKAIHTLGDSAIFRKSLAAIIMDRGGEDASERLETVLHDINKLPENEQLDLWKFVAVLFNRLGKSDRAIELCETAAKKNPNDLFIRRTLFVLALDANNKKVMDKTLEEVAQIDQKGPYWNYLSALRLVYPILDKKEVSKEDQEIIETAIAYLNTAEIQRPNWGKTSLLLGRLYHKIGNIKAAASNLAHSIEFGERDSIGLALLADIYLREGRSLEAQTILDMMRHSDQGLNADGLFALAQTKLRQGDKLGALAELIGAIEILQKEAVAKNDAKTYIKLAQMFSNAGIVAQQVQKEDLALTFRQQAKDMVVKASEVEPSDYRPWIILAKLYKDQGKNELIEEVITQIKNNVSGQDQQISLAKCYEVLNRTVEAELACEKALESAKTDNDISREVAAFYLRNKRDTEKQNPKAEAILRKILSGELPASQDDIMWARRRLAVILFTKGLQKDRKEAMQLISKNLETDPSSLMDLRVQARGLAMKGTRKDKLRSIKLLEDLVKRPNPSYEDRFQLAKLYWAHRNWNGTSEQMQILLGSSKPEAKWYEFYIRCLINRNEYSSAQTHWEKLKAMRPNLFVTSELEAFIYAGNNSPQKAIAELEAFLKNPQAIPDNELVKLTLVAKTAEGLATRISQKENVDKKIYQRYVDFAEKCYREIAQKHSKYEMTLASFLGRYGKRDEAIDLAEKAWKTNKPQIIAAATVRLLNTGNATPKEIERVEKILSNATDHFGDRTSLDLAMAELRTLQKRYDDAERIHREVLKKDPDNVIALNNLAVFLALRKIKLDEALKYINRAIDLAGAQATLLDSRASVYLARNELQKALDDIDAALQEHHSAVRFFHQAQIQMVAGEKDEARKSIDEAINLGLQVDQLQPLERPAYRALREALR